MVYFSRNEDPQQTDKILVVLIKQHSYTISFFADIFRCTMISDISL